MRGNEPVPVKFDFEIQVNQEDLQTDESANDSDAQPIEEEEPYTIV